MKKEFNATIKNVCKDNRTYTAVPVYATCKKNNADAPRNFKTAMASASATDATAADIDTFARAIAYSVQKKLYAVSGNETVLELTAATRAASVALDNALVKDTIGDGYDMVQTAAVGIMDARNRAAATGTPCDMERAYTVRELDKRVLIKSDASAAFRERETNAVRETFRAVRNYVSNNRAVHVEPTCKYVYYSEVVTDADAAADADKLETIVYRRLPKYMQVACDIHGTATTTTTATTTAADADARAAMIEKLNLTAKQTRVLEYRERGYGNRAIATCLGVSSQAVAKTIKQIRVKAVACGYTPRTCDVNAANNDGYNGGRRIKLITAADVATARANATAAAAYATDAARVAVLAKMDNADNAATAAAHADAARATAARAARVAADIADAYNRAIADAARAAILETTTTDADAAAIADAAAARATAERATRRAAYMVNFTDNATATARVVTVSDDVHADAAARAAAIADAARATQRAADNAMHAADNAAARAAAARATAERAARATAAARAAAERAAATADNAATRAAREYTARNRATAAANMDAYATATTAAAAYNYHMGRAAFHALEYRYLQDNANAPRRAARAERARNAATAANAAAAAAYMAI